MNKKYLSKAAIVALTFIFVLGLVLPANAFYMEVPKSLKNIHFYKTASGVTLVQYVAPSPNSASAPQPYQQQPYQQPTGDQYQQPTQQNYQQPYQQPMDSQYQQPTQQNQQQPYQQNQQCAPGTDCGGQSGCAPGTQCDSGSGGQSGPGGQGQIGPQGQSWGEGQGQGQEQGEQNEKMEQQRKAREEQDLKRMKRDMSRMGSMVTQYERMIAQAEKKGAVVSAEVKGTLAKLKSILEAVKNATNFEELQAAGVEEMQELTQSLEEFRRDVVEAQQRMDGIKRGLKGMEQGMRMFEKQIAMLTKQKIAIPQDVTDNLNKVKTIIAAIKTAKTWEEMETAGIEDMQDLFMSLDESRQKLEVLARWPQTLKQINAELNRLAAALKRAKILTAQLSKKGVDLSGVYSEFESAVNKLKSIRDEAAAKIAAGESEEAFNLLENDFFGQMEDVWEHQKLIEMMSNLGRFASDFKRGIAQTQQTINMLKRKKIDTAELSELLSQAKTKGDEVLSLMKQKPIDTDAVINGIQELEDMRQTFDEKAGELGGEENIMPWEKGPQQFKGVSMPSNFNQYIPKKETQPQQGPEGGIGPSSESGPGGSGPGGAGPGF